MSIGSEITYKLGQVGGFPLRLSWLPRLVSLDKNISFHKQEDAGLTMGIGMNMVRALRIWARASGIVNSNDALTERAFLFFGEDKGVDKYAEKDETLWLLHWLICSNLECFTANGWLLNFFHSRSFTQADALDAFFARLERDKANYAKGTIRVDLETAIRMYVSVKESKKQNDLDDRCFHSMRLFQASRESGQTQYIRVLRDEQPRLKSNVVVYSIIDAMSKRKVSTSAFSDLYASENTPSPGVVFGLTKDGFWAALETAAAKHSKILSLHSMPDGDAQVRLIGKHGQLAESGDKFAADTFYFSAKK